MIIGWIRKYFRNRFKARACKYLTGMPISLILENAGQADNMYDGIAEEYLKEIHKRRDHFDFEIIKNKEPSNHSCNAIDYNIVCFEKEDGLWVKEYCGVGFLRKNYREGRTYKV